MKERDIFLRDKLLEISKKTGQSFSKVSQKAIKLSSQNLTIKELLETLPNALLNDE